MVKTRKRSSTPIAQLTTRISRAREEKPADIAQDIANVLHHALTRRSHDPEYGKVWNMVPPYVVMNELGLIDHTRLALVTTKEYDEKSSLPVALHMAPVTEEGKDLYRQLEQSGYYRKRK